MDSKPIWSSKTFWANIVGAAAGLAALYGIDVPPEDQVAIVGGILGLVNVVNILLRIVTHTSIRLRKDTE